MFLQNKQLKFHDSLSDSVVNFTPIDENNIKMYVCGPTVYSAPHIGNARSFVFYDVVFRVLREIYPNVTYVRNITDVDDKIIAQAAINNENPIDLTNRIICEFRNQTSLLNCLIPTIEPKATEHILEMIDMIDSLIQKGFAYISNNHVYFSVSKFPEYCALSNKDRSELISGARVDIAESKQNAEDFVLWKPALSGEVGFESKFGFGRPGWHIECSAMSHKYLGESFDIHGGGADLKFPHHDNEIAQSKCANGGDFAKYWLHNGFLMVNGEKMSKSLGNFTTIDDLLQSNADPMAIRLSLLSTIYSKPLNFTPKLLQDSILTMKKFNKIVNDFEIIPDIKTIPDSASDVILNNFNIPKYIALMHVFAHDITYNRDRSNANKAASEFYNMGKLIGIFPDKLTKNAELTEIPEFIINIAEQRQVAKRNKDFQLADRLRQEILENGYKILDTQDGFKIEKI